jgi:hypothetical protein
MSWPLMPDVLDAVIMRIAAIAVETIFSRRTSS